MKYEFKNPQFIKSAVKPENFPVLRDIGGRILPEIAVAGRSNVGKSSLINHLFRHGKMAKTSQTPGKTQLLNFFTINDALAFCDLPGYGFAKVPGNIRRSWGGMIQAYLEGRPSLKLILFLFDIRRTPNDEDRQLLDWIAHNHKAMILVLTKSDKLKKGVRQGARQKILKAFNADNIHAVFYSTTKNLGRPQLINLINEALTTEEETGEEKI
jgi:GTP-binding protein